MKRLQAVSANLGLGFASVYALFLVPSISEIFPPSSLVLIKQGLVLGFSICLLASPKSVISLGHQMVPKIISILSLFYTKGKSNDSGTDS